MVNLIYVALRAILRGSVPLDLIRRIYECRMMAENGEFAPPDEASGMDVSARYALAYAASCRVTELFSFSLSPEAERDFTRYVKKCLAQCVDKKFHSLMMIE
jgi:DNA repair protein RecO (recombination protein O)